MHLAGPYAEDQLIRRARAMRKALALTGADPVMPRRPRTRKLRRANGGQLAMLERSWCPLPLAVVLSADGSSDELWYLVLNDRARALPPTRVRVDGKDTDVTGGGELTRLPFPELTERQVETRVVER